jgi:hypothetical protein
MYRGGHANGVTRFLNRLATTMFRVGIWPTRDSAVAEWRIGGHVLMPEITVDADGSLPTVTMSRWAQPKGEEWGNYPFGGSLEAESVFEGTRVTTRAQVGYFFGSDRWEKGEFFRATIMSTTYS